MRWFSTISAEFKKRKWRQLESDPCIFGMEENDLVIGIAALHADDILFAGSTGGWEEFHKLLSSFGHSGVGILPGRNRLMYLGLNLGKVHNELFLSQDSFIETKLVDVPEAGWADKREVERTIELRKTSGKRAVGMKIWLVQTRSDVSQSEAV